MKINLFITLVLIFNFVNISAQTKEEKKKSKEAIADESYIEMKALINSGNYSFYARTLRSQNGKTIYLSGGEYNYLIVEQAKAKADLQYLGVSQSPIYGNGNGIEFENDNVTYEITFDDKKRKIDVTFKTNNKSENFTISLSVFGNGNAHLNVYTPKRDGIGYDGDVKKLKK